MNVIAPMQSQSSDRRRIYSGENKDKTIEGDVEDGPSAG